ncbi:hypothetical protein H6G33_08670 [Calothrix sp. FACHB-1219]|uniref:hypothetical protein n=1 Tax=unclassified Calothrix TaxID=2619626 RepID=UPI00168317D7|nr:MULTISPECIES: hypothetical protein [unclassified Calothrix]MBD2202068.1 hypothetical protein [Calothrix sp. FACHB-168]MBD2217103.1 hypothetical protein [Calothrix sp. FACHB-1219]
MLIKLTQKTPKNHQQSRDNIQLLLVNDITNSEAEIVTGGVSHPPRFWGSGGGGSGGSGGGGWNLK